MIAEPQDSVNGKKITKYFCHGNTFNESTRCQIRGLNESSWKLPEPIFKTKIRKIGTLNQNIGFFGE